jgi:hypothetical protein
VVEDYEPWHRFVSMTLKSTEIAAIGEAVDGLDGSESRRTAAGVGLLDIDCPS